MLTLKIVGPLWGLIWKPSVGNSADHCFQKLFKDASCRMRKYGRCNLPRWYRPRCRRFLYRQVWRVNLHWTFWLVVSTILKNMKVNGKDYSIYYGKLKKWLKPPTSIGSSTGLPWATPILGISCDPLYLLRPSNSRERGSDSGEPAGLQFHPENGAQPRSVK